MKKFRFVIFFSLIVCCLLALFGCNKSDMETPKNLVINQDTLVLSWDEVEDARYYTISVSGKNDDSSKTSYSLTKLDPGEYTIKVKANAGGRNGGSSSWSKSIPFVREEEPGMIFKLINEGTEYEVANVGTAEGDIVVPSEYRGRPVTSIGRRAFASKPMVTSVVLPETITNIGEQAFNKCSYLKSVNIPAAVTSIGTKAFQSCGVLESAIVIPEGVTEIPDGVFNYCYKIPSITIGSNVKTIGEFAFASCTSIPKIEIPDSVQSVGLSSFSDCTAATTLTMGTGLVQIGNEAFSGCVGLTSITVGENVKYIGSGAFMKCINIESVTMEDDVVSIGGEAFADCAKLAEVDMSSNIVSVGYQAFVNTKIWTDASNIVYVGDWLVDTKVKDAAVYEIEEGTFGIAIGAFAFLTTVNSITLPNSVKIIDSQAFVNCNELTTVIIGSGVEVIRTRAFGSCVKLSNVVLGEYDWNTSKIKESSLQRIEQYAFMNCKLLSYIDIPDTVEFIGGYAFRKTALISVNGVMYADDWIVDYDDMGMLMAMMMGWNGELKEGTRGVGEYAFYKAQLLSNVVLPESVEIINRCAFMEASALNSVVLPSTLTSIEEYTFYSCYNILQIELPETLEYIGTGAFRNCLGLGLKIENNAIVNTDEDTFVIPDSVKEIGDYAFYGCGVNQPIDADGNTELWGTDILVIGDGVTKIGKNAFANFISLTDVQIGANVETIGEKAFYKATALKNVTFGEKVTSIGKRAFYGCTALESIVLPESVTVIDDYTFYKCEKVKSISLGSGVTTIGKYAFYGCKELKSLSIPESVVSIGKLAFRNASEVKSLVIYDTLATIENYAFYNWKNVTFYVVSSTAGENWGERWNSSHRPVVWGVTLSDEGYVVSFTKTATSFDNFNDKTVVNGPERAGYTFAGWTSVQGGAVEYTASNVVNAPDGTVLYAVWKVAITE